MIKGTAYETAIAKDGLTNWEIIALAAEACDRLEWPYTVRDNTGLTAITNPWETAGEQLLLSFENGMINIRSEHRFAETFGLGRNQQNVEQHFLPAYLLMKATIPAERLQSLTFAIENKERLEAEAYHERIENGDLTAAEKIAMGVGVHNVTYGLIAVNVIVFLVMGFSGVNWWEPSTRDIVNWGGNYKAFVAAGQWWRLLSCVFVHIGFIHLAFNMYALYIIGSYLEPLLGKWKFVTAHLCTGIFASLTSILWHGDKVSAGASGAIFGMYGFFLALLTTDYIDKDARKRMLISIGIFTAYNLLNGLQEGIDNAAHTGGLISGFLIGYVFYFLELKTNAAPKKDLNFCVLVAVTTLILSFITIQKLL